MVWSSIARNSRSGSVIWVNGQIAGRHVKMLKMLRLWFYNILHACDVRPAAFAGSFYAWNPFSQHFMASTHSLQHDDGLACPLLTRKDMVPAASGCACESVAINIIGACPGVLRCLHCSDHGQPSKVKGLDLADLGSLLATGSQWKEKPDHRLIDLLSAQQRDPIMVMNLNLQQ